MFKKTKIINIEISQPPDVIDNLQGYAMLQALVRFHGTPLGYVRYPLLNGCCSVQDLLNHILDKLSGDITLNLLCNWLLTYPKTDKPAIEDLINLPKTGNNNKLLPSVSVAVCTRNRVEDLKLCLASILSLDYPKLDIMVIDNAPNNDDTKSFVTMVYPDIRYIREPRPGLNWARNRAILEARGDIIAFTDDDVVVENGWIKALCAVFAETPQVMAVTGLVVPYEIETEAQELFEQYGGFGRGFKRNWYRGETLKNEKLAALHGGTGKFGTGANMAYRRSLFHMIGYFDTALDVGTVTNGGGDLEMFFRVLKEGHTLVYEPNAVVFHRHRRYYNELLAQITTWGIGFSAYLVRSALAYPDERLAFLKLWARWIRIKMRTAFFSFLRPTRTRELLMAELKGLFIGLFRYHKARYNAKKIMLAFGAIDNSFVSEPMTLPHHPSISQNKTTIRVVDISQQLQQLTDVMDYTRVNILVQWKDQPLGILDIPACGEFISPNRLCELIGNTYSHSLPMHVFRCSADSFRSDIFAALKHHYMPSHGNSNSLVSDSLSTDISVSVVIATYDRPDDLRDCLTSLLSQNTKRPVEIIVVDNHPASHITPPVVNEFPDVMLVTEPRKGLSFARNKGIAVCSGDIVITTDDDVTLPSDWLDTLIAPFGSPAVGAVTGNVFPKELETKAQYLFELYGGLGRGFDILEADRKWFESGLRQALPTWKLGSTANAAFRVGIFSHSQIGLMDETLGAGTPTGCSEDTYLFYKILKAGYTIVYEPKAYVWHKHRRTMSALRHQIYNYSKGHVAYHLKTLFDDHDCRALMRLMVELPKHHVSKLKQWLVGKRTYPLSLTLIEVIGNFVGPFALLRSSLRVRRIGCSRPYIPVSKRLINIRSQGLVSKDLT
ncbi:MAG: glycosyltransferase [Thermodesulfovibrionales bacterium]|nr:glycosyltransferase [Thermodesulfovibrionales bacterium]